MKDYVEAPNQELNIETNFDDGRQQEERHRLITKVFKIFTKIIIIILILDYYISSVLN